MCVEVENGKVEEVSLNGEATTILQFTSSSVLAARANKLTVLGQEKSSLQVQAVLSAGPRLAALYQIGYNSNSLLLLEQTADGKITETKVDCDCSSSGPCYCPSLVHLLRQLHFSGPVKVFADRVTRQTLLWLGGSLQKLVVHLVSVKQLEMLAQSGPATLSVDDVEVTSPSGCFNFSALHRLFPNVSKLTLRQALFDGRWERSSCSCRKMPGRDFGRLVSAILHTVCDKAVSLLCSASQNLRILELNKCSRALLSRENRRYRPKSKFSMENVRRAMTSLLSKSKARPSSHLTELIVRDTTVDLSDINDWLPGLQQLEVEGDQILASRVPDVTSSSSWFSSLMSASVIFTSTSSDETPLFPSGIILPSLQHYRQSFGRLEMSKLSVDQLPRLAQLTLDPVLVGEERLPNQIEHLEISWCDLETISCLLRENTSLRMLRLLDPVHTNKTHWLPLVNELTLKNIDVVLDW